MGPKFKVQSPLVVAMVSVLLPALALIYWTQTAVFGDGPITSVTALAADNAEWVDHGDWQVVHLPKRRCRVSESPCYDQIRVSFDYDGETVMGVFIQEIVGSLRVSVNGTEVFTIGSIDAPVPAMHYAPTYRRLPRHLLKTGQNELQMTLTNAPGRFHRVKPLYIAADAELSKFARPLIWLVTDTVYLTLGVFAAAIMFALLLYFSADRSQVYLWFALLCGCSILRNLFFVLSDPSLEGVRISAYFIGSNIQLTAVAGLVGYLLHPHLVNRYLFVNLLMLGWVFVLLSWITFNPSVGGHVANVGTALAFLVIGLYVLFGICLYYVKQRSTTAAWMVASVIGSYFLTLNDALPMPFGTATLFPLAHLSPLLLVCAFLFFVVGEYRRVLVALNSAAVDKAAALEIQRDNIKRDLHDGLGGSISGLLMLARRKSPELAPYLQESLDELRLVMNELDNYTPQCVSDIVSELRPKIHKVLAGHGLRDRWEVAGDFDAQLSAQSRKALYFAIQETVHNIVRHARAQNVEFQFSQEQTHVVIEVSDDGLGIESTERVLAADRGLAGLQKRLAAVQGWLRIRSEGHGTSIQFALPMES